METKKCTHCGRTVLANSKICKHCGQSFGCEDIVLDETIKPESEQLQTSQSIDLEKSEDAIQQNRHVSQPIGEAKDLKKWLLLAIVGILAVSFFIYWISRTHGEEVSATIKVDEESELNNNEDEPEIKENIEFVAPELSSDKEENGREENEISFTLLAPEATANGTQIMIQYVLKNNDEATDIQVPNKISGFEILYGPSISRNYTSTLVNGIQKTENSITHSYVLMATTEGVFKLPAATIKCKGRIYTSNTAQIKVLPPNANVQPEQQKQTVVSESKDATVSPNDIFIRPIIRKKPQVVSVTFKLYTTLNLTKTSKINLLDLPDLPIEEIDLPKDQEFGVEHYNGRNYYTLEIKKILLYPQKSGKIIIPKVSTNVVLSVPSGKKTQTFFGPQEVMQEITKEVVSSTMSIDVEKTSSFN